MSNSIDIKQILGNQGDYVDNTNKIDDMVVEMDHRFIKKVSNCFIAYISQSCFV